MLEIMKDGPIENDGQILELAQRYGQVVLPNENEDLDLTHWWVIREEGAEMLYVGTPETFARYVKEQNGGVQ